MFDQRIHRRHKHIEYDRLYNSTVRILPDDNDHLHCNLNKRLIMPEKILFDMVDQNLVHNLFDKWVDPRQSIGLFEIDLFSLPMLNNKREREYRR